MRLTPSQIGFLELMGEDLPSLPEADTVERMRRGREALVSITGQDFGFDLVRWHEHLRETDAGGYRWSNKHLGMPRQIAVTLANAEWQDARKQIEKKAAT
jgi:hypothetical protein